MVTRALIALALAAIPQDAQTRLPLVITRVSIETDHSPEPGLGVLRAEVLNTGARTILAWGVRYELRRPDGTIDPTTHGFSIDSGSNPERERSASVAPGKTLDHRVGLVPTNTALKDSAVTFVIFDDDTAMGDERLITSIFDERRTSQLFWQKMQAILEDAASRGPDPTAVMSHIRERLEADPDPKFRIIPWYREFLERMSARRMNPVGATSQGVLSDIVSTVSQHKANADAHATRR